MRSTIVWITLGLVLVLVGAAALARADDTPAADGLDEMQARIDVLESQVAYLLERDRDLTSHALANRERGKALVIMASTMRAQGFQNRAIPPDSRETLLKGLDALGREMQEGLPVVTKAQAARLLEAKRAGR